MEHGGDETQNKEIKNEYCQNNSGKPRANSPTVQIRPEMCVPRKISGI
jgi:hypothetical protein